MHSCMPSYIQMKEIRGKPVGETIGTDLLRRGQERAALTAVHGAGFSIVTALVLLRTTSPGACIRFAEALGGGRCTRVAACSRLSE